MKRRRTGVPPKRHTGEHQVKAIIREATQSDQEALAALFTSLADEHLDGIGIVFDTTPVLPEHVGTIVELMGSQGTPLLVAERGSALWGFLLLGGTEKSVATQYAGLTMAVARNRRRQGIGSALLSGAQRWAETQRLGELRLTVRRHNRAAIRLYETSGFETIGETETDIKMRW